MTESQIKPTADHARILAFNTLAASLNGGYIDDLLHKELDKSHLDNRERRFVTELVLGATRMRLRLDHALKPCYKGRFGGLEPVVKMLLRLGAYQLLFMDSVPDHAAVNTTVDIARAVDLARVTKLTNGVLRQLSRQQPLTMPSNDAPVRDLAAAWSHPEWLIEKWAAQWGRDRTVDLMAWNNQRPTLWFRVREDETRQMRLLEAGLDAGLSFIPHDVVDGYVSVDGNPAPLFEKSILDEGLFIVQDPAAGAIIEAVAPQPGEVIIDLCAGPGGKTAALADAVGPKGKVIACEIDPHRVQLINDTVNRLGLSNVQIYPGDARKIDIPKADKILVDAPCSGTGVMSRRADLRWLRKPWHIVEMAALQDSLLTRAMELSHQGSIIIYGTCSLEPEENWGAIQRFQEHNPDYYLDPMPESISKSWLDENGALATSPSEHHVDGVYAVRMKRS